MPFQDREAGLQAQVVKDAGQLAEAAAVVGLQPSAKQGYLHNRTRLTPFVKHLMNGWRAL